MATKIQVLNGDIPSGQWTATGTPTGASMSNGSQAVSLNDLTMVYQISENLDVDTGGAAACGIFGGLLFGPLGALAGAAFGGNRKQITFKAHFANGKTFTGMVEKSKFPILLALAN